MLADEAGAEISKLHNQLGRCAARLALCNFTLFSLKMDLLECCETRTWPKAAIVRLAQ